MGEEEKERQRIRKIAELKTFMEERVQELKKETDGLQALLELVDSALLEKGFKRAEIEKTAAVSTVREAQPQSSPTAELAEPSHAVERERTVPIKMVTGELLATLYVGEDFLRVVLANDKQFDINTPPFMSFLVERVLVKIQNRDREAERAGEITPEKMLSYNIVRDGDIIREITIRNISPERSQELKSSIRWTLEKMYEKMTKTNP